MPSSNANGTPVSGGFGRWLNGIGQWDWWELGGRFNGIITGQARGAFAGRTAISSGFSAGREALERLAGALGDALDQPEPIDIASDDNIEMVSTLVEALGQDSNATLPGALVLPPGSVPDEERWLDQWPDLHAAAGLNDGVDLARPPWRGLVGSNYARFADHWAAAVAYHF